MTALKFWKALNEIFYRLVIIVFGIVMLIGAWQVYDNYYIFSHALDKDLLKYKPVHGQSADESSPITDEMVAWLTIDGTNIDYPVMQGKSNTDFLNTDPFGNYALTGSIFLDSRCSADFSDKYSLIYGHHMDYGKMFGSLDDFLSESYLRKHTTGTLLVGRNAEKEYKLRVFAAMRVSSRDKTVFDINKDKIQQYIKDNAKVYTKQEQKRIIGLSTCADAGSVNRIVVFCYILD